MFDLRSEYLFPSPVYHGEVDSLVLNDVENSLEDVYNNSNSSVVWNSANLVGDPRFDVIKNNFKSSCRLILEEQGYDISRYNLHVSSLWAQELKKGGHHEPHVHPNSIMCGIFFIKNTEQGSFVFFKDSRLMKEGFDLSIKNTDDASVANPYINLKGNSHRGSLLIFNSYLSHGLVPNSSDSSVKFVHMNLSCNEK